MSYCDTCGHQYSDVCGGCETLYGVPVKYKKKTNADRIRAMTDEELAEYLNEEFHVLHWCDPPELKIPSDSDFTICGKEPCEKCTLEWLKQEVGT